MLLQMNEMKEGMQQEILYADKQILKEIMAEMHKDLVVGKVNLRVKV